MRPLIRRSSPCRLLSPAVIGALSVACALAVPAVATADVLDLALHRLVPKPTTPGGFAEPTALSVQSDYRQLVSELGTALAPKILTTADTIGYAGFQFSFDASFTSISNQTCTTDQCPWRGVEGKSPTNPSIPGYVTTLSVYARKGIWLPLPSFEIGAGATKLMQSDLFAVQVYGKLALHEGFHDWPIPSLAIRGSGMRVMGTSQIDLTMAQIDVEISKSFGIAGTVTLTPYLGAASLLIIAKGQVLDTTPNCDAFKMTEPTMECPAGGPSSLDLNANAVFPDQDTIVRWRFFGGLRLQYAVLVLTADVLYTACGDFSGGSCNHEGKKIPDRSDHQLTFSVSGGFLF